jgi:hypothetical protein
MKKLFILLFCLTLNNLFSQTFPAEDTTAPRIIKDTCWKTSGFIGINFAQTTLSNWQGGGEDNFSLIGILNYEAIYRKDKNLWENKIDAQYGMIRSGTANVFKKNADQLLALTKFSLKATEKYWYYTLFADFRTQFSPGYNYYADSIAPGIVSNLMAPAYVQLALGMDFKIEDYFTITFAPVAGKMTIVNDRGLADEGAFGVKPAVRDTAGKVITPGEKIRYEFGGRVTIKFKKDLSKNVSVDSYADFFSNYLHNPQNVDIVWNTLVNFKITKFISATISTKLIYDDDIIIKYDWNEDGKYDHKNDIYGPRAQWLNNFGFGLGYKF